METVIDVDSKEINPYETRDRFARLIIGTAAGFIAGRMAENAYDTIVAKYRRNRL